MKATIIPILIDVLQAWETTTNEMKPYQYNNMVIVTKISKDLPTLFQPILPQGTPSEMLAETSFLPIQVNSIPPNTNNSRYENHAKSYD